MLKSFQSITGRETLFEEQYSEEEVAAELAPLTVQLAFVLSQTGRTEDALEQYDAVLQQQNVDEATTVVATVNWLAASCALRNLAASDAKKFLTACLKRLEAYLTKVAALRIVHLDASTYLLSLPVCGLVHCGRSSARLLPAFCPSQSVLLLQPWILDAHVSVICRVL